MRTKDKPADFALAYVMTPYWWHNYYHFIVDGLGRLVELMNEGVVTEDMKIIVPFALEPFHQRFFNLLGIDPHRIVVAQDRPIKVKRLIFSSWRRCWHMPSGVMLRQLREAVTRRAGIADVAPSRRIYLSRRSATARRLLNEEAVEALLSERGFEIIRPETLSVEEQIELMHESSLIVGPHGAAMTNLVFAYDCRVIEIFPDDQWDLGHYLAISGTLGFPHACLICKPRNENLDYSVDLDDLRNCVDRCIEDGENSSRGEKAAT